jgi:mercuric ion transport protein
MNIFNAIERSVRETDKALAAGGLVSAAAAVVGASCCTIPLILANLGLGLGAASWLPWLAAYRTYFIALAVVAILVGFIIAFRPGRKHQTKTLVILAVATLLTVASFVLPTFEGRLLRLIQG